MLSDHMKEYVQQLLDQSLMLMESPETIDEAIEKLKLVLKVEPTNAEANYTLAKVYLTKEKYSDALHHLELIKGEEYTEKDIYSEIKKTRQIIKEKDIESEVITNHTDIRKHKKIISFIPIKKPDIRNLFSQINTGENRIHILSNLILIVACYLLLRSSLHDGYPQSHLDATVAFYIAKIKMIILNRSLYTPSWYFGYELLKFYPPLSTIIPAILALLAGNVQYSYLIHCLLHRRVLSGSIHVHVKTCWLHHGVSMGIQPCKFHLLSRTLLGDVQAHRNRSRTLGSLLPPANHK